MSPSAALVQCRLSCDRDFKLSSGRMFQPGLTEAVVSKRIAERFQGLDIGDKFRIQTTDYTVVGLFDSAGKAFESEIWVDANSLASTTNREILLFGFAARERSECDDCACEANHGRSKTSSESCVGANIL